MPMHSFAVAAVAALAVDVYTMEQGAHPFERFGHAAICVVADGHPERSRCYNYGTTDFGSPPAELGWRFLRGDAEFWVSVWPVDRMVAAYARADRTTWRQRLSLTPEEVEAVRAALEHDALPEHRRYHYHHFLDNCSTRVRDVVDRGTGGRLTRAGDRPFGATYRQLVRRGLAELPAALLASDLVLGRLADRPLDARAAMFLPTVLRAEITGQLGAEPVLVHRRRGRAFAEQGPSGRGAVAALAAALAALAAVGARSRRRRWPLLIPIAAGLGGLGATLWLVATVSTVPELRWNEALLAFWPTDLALPGLRTGALRAYSRVRCGVTLLHVGLLASGLLTQPLLAALLLPLGVFAPLAWARDGALRSGAPSGGGRRRPGRPR